MMTQMCRHAWVHSCFSFTHSIHFLGIASITRECQKRCEHFASHQQSSCLVPGWGRISHLLLLLSDSCHPEIYSVIHSFSRAMANAFGNRHWAEQKSKFEIPLRPGIYKFYKHFTSHQQSSCTVPGWGGFRTDLAAFRS